MSSSSSVDLFSYSAASSSSCAYAASFSIREVQRREYVKSIVFGEDIGPKVARFVPIMFNVSQCISSDSEAYYSETLTKFCQKIGVSKYYQVASRAICNIKSLPDFNRDKISLRLRTRRIFCDLFKNIKSFSVGEDKVGERFLRTIFPNFDLSSPSNVIDHYVCPEILEQMHNWIEDANLILMASRITNLRTPFANVSYQTFHEWAQNVRSWLMNIPDNSIQNVTELNLSNLGLTLIPGEINQFPNLGGVDLSNNKITHIAPNAFMGLWNLDFLFLEHNRITQIAADAFRGLGNLQTLYLDHNKITQIGANAFTGLGNQTNLTIDDTYLDYLPKIRDLPLNIQKQLQSKLHLTAKGIFLQLISIPSKIIYFVLNIFSSLLAGFKRILRVFS